MSRELSSTLVVEDIKRLIAIAEKYHDALDQATAVVIELNHAIIDICAKDPRFIEKFGGVPPTPMPSKFPWWPAFEQIVELERIKKGYGL